MWKLIGVAVVAGVVGACTLVGASEPRHGWTCIQQTLGPDPYFGTTWTCRDSVQLP